LPRPMIAVFMALLLLKPDWLCGSNLRRSDAADRCWPAIRVSERGSFAITPWHDFARSASLHTEKIGASS